MSLELMREALLDDRAPYPVPLQPLNLALTSLVGYNGSVLYEACKPLLFYVGQDRPTTSDGYTWFWSQNFHTPSGTVRVCIPWSQDWARRDGSSMDRSAAVYAGEGVSGAEVLCVTACLTMALGMLVAQQKQSQAAHRVATSHASWNLVPR